MDTANDNPLRRFSSFWLGLLLFGVFGVLSLFFGFWFNKPVEQAYDEFNTKRRLKIKSEVLESHAGARETAARSFEKVGSTLLTSTPTAVEKPEFVLPGSQTAKEAAAAGNTGIEVPEDFPQVAADAPVDPAMMEVGKTLYGTCLACHGPDAKQRKADLRLDTREGALAYIDGTSAVVPGKPSESELIRRVTTDDEDDLMPPPDSGKKLDATQKALLQRWIAEGAEYELHWSYKQIGRAHV